MKALIRAGQWLDASPANRKQAVAILARPEYVGADAAVIANSMTGFFEYEKGDRREMPDFNVFFRDFATYPFYSDGVWYLTQMRRWGQIPEAKPDAWYDETIRTIYRPDVWREAAERLVAEGRLARRRRARRPTATRRPTPASSTASSTTAASRTPTCARSRSA